jgi:hypothetical protein
MPAYLAYFSFTNIDDTLLAMGGMNTLIDSSYYIGTPHVFAWTYGSAEWIRLHDLPRPILFAGVAAVSGVLVVLVFCVIYWYDNLQN